MMKKLRKLVCVLLIFTLTGTLLTGCKNEFEGKAGENVSGVRETPDTSYTETVEEQVLVDENGVKIVLKELTNSSTYGKGMILEMENNTIQTLMFDCKKMIVNDHMVGSLVGEMLTPGEKKSLTAYFSSNVTDYLGVGKIGEIIVQFDFYDSETFISLFKTDDIVIKTSEYDNMITEIDFWGEEIYEGNGLTISGAYAEEDMLFDSALLLYIENNSDVEYLLKAESVTINGVQGGNMVVNNVSGGTKSLFYIEFDLAEIESSGISEVEELQVELDILDRSKAEIIDTTGVLTITTTGN